MLKKGAEKSPYFMGVLVLLLIAVFVIAAYGAYFVVLDRSVVLQSSNSNVNLNLTKDNLTLSYTGVDVSKVVYSWIVNGKNILVLNTLTSKNITFAASNGNVTDFSGNNFNGTAYGGAGWKTPEGFDGFGAYIFNGSNSTNITYGPLSAVINGKNFSWGAWINASSYPLFSAGAGIISEYNSTHNYELALDDDGSLVCRLNNVTGVFTIGNTTVSNISLRTKYFAFCVFEGSTTPTLKLYLNGTNVAQTPVGGTLNLSKSLSLTIGASESANTGGFNGSIRNVQIWNRSLTAFQINLMYNSGAGNYSTIHNNETERTEIWNVTVWALNSTGEVNATNANHTNTSNTINITTGPERGDSRNYPNISMNEDNVTAGYGNQTIVENAVFDVSTYFNDSDGTTLTFAINTASSNLTNLTVVLNSSGILHLNASGNYTTLSTGSSIVGKNYIVFYANDSFSNSSVSNTVYITVNPVDDDPYFTGTIPDFSLIEGESTVTTDLSTYFKEVDNDTRFYLYDTRISDVAGLTLTFTQATGSVAVSAGIGVVGERNVTFNVTDGVGTNATSNKVTITVNARSSGSTSSGGGGVPAAEGEVKQVTLQEGQPKSIGLGEGSSAEFEYKGENHKITATRVTSSTATVEVESLKRTYVMKILEKKELDLDTDGKKDMRIQLMSIADGTATLTVTLLAPVVLPLTIREMVAQAETAEESEVSEELDEGAEDEVFDGGEALPRRIPALTWVLVLVVLAVAGIAGYFAYQKKSKK